MAAHSEHILALGRSGIALIAIVEDDSVLAELLAEVLRLEGYNSLICSHADGAFEKIRTARADLILLDMRLEDRNSGWLLLRKLRSVSATARIPVIVCSADQEALANNAVWLTVEGIPTILKPFDLNDLLAAIRRYLPTQCGSPPAVLDRVT